MQRILACVSIALLCGICLGAGYIFGGSNLGFGGYPDYNALEPTRPYSKDEYSFDRYRLDVEQYVDEAQEYVKNAQNDKERINNAIKDAIEKANNAVEEFNRWARSPY